MKTIVAIGGGDMLSTTRPIDEEIVRLSGKRKPKALMVPTASGDPESYFESFNRAYEDVLGCRTDVLLLISTKPSMDEIAKKVLSSDLIYVGGGSTLNLMRIWKRTGADRVLREAYDRGIVLSGISAGANCWFQHCHSDSPLYFVDNPVSKFMRVTSMGLLKGTFCPHFIPPGAPFDEGRFHDFPKMIAKYGGVGYGIDNDAALVVEDDKMRVIRCTGAELAKKLWRVKGCVVIEDLP